MFSYQMGTNPDQEFEVGWQYHGIPTSEEKMAGLQKMLDLYGTDPNIWQCYPEIRTVPARVESPYFNRDMLEVFPDAWAVYGVLIEKPEKGWVPEGVRIPLHESIEDEVC